MKFLTIILFFISFQTLSYEIQSRLFEKAPFVKHEEKGPWGSYLVMNISFAPVKELFKAIDKDLDNALNKTKARKEAHITIITPVEFNKALKKYISIKEIHEIAKRYEIQNFYYQLVCLGRRSAQINNKEESTYYLVVQSREFVELRKKIGEVFFKRGGSSSQFNPLVFYPHITVGYTLKDLHLESHGVKKDSQSCWKGIALK